MPWLARTGRAAAVVGLSVAYVGSVFRLWGTPFWTAGLADWIDPYFINSLLESWYYSLRRFENPASPPVFYPTPGTLGYSHGLILFVPFYVPLRMALHPFQAYNATILLVVLSGTWSLYAVLRRAFALSFIEAGLLTACFAASANVLNEPMNVWTQRASVYLVPPILLTGWMAVSTAGRAGAVYGFITGLLATLLYTQDFYSGHFTWFFAVCGVISIWAGSVDVRSGLRGWSRLERIAAAVAVAAAAWGLYLATAGGGVIDVLGLRIRSSNPSRPLILAVIGSAIVIVSRLRREGLPHVRLALPSRRLLPFAAGAALGALIFLWIYLPIYLDFGGFNPDEYLRVLKGRDPAILLHPARFIETHDGFPTLQPFALVLIVTAAAWLGHRHVPRALRIATLIWLAVSFVVLLIPFRFGEFTIWGSVIRPLPGFNAIRDPLRIIYQYQLAVVVATAVLMGALPRPGWLRMTLAVAVAAGLYLAPNDTFMRYGRPNQEFDRWVGAPIRVDPSCRSFYMSEGPPEYVSRSPEPWTLYSNDAAFIALRLGIPTLHGVSAWTPRDWRVRQPHDPDFAAGVREWIQRHGLRDVCAMDVGRRMMGPPSTIAP